MKTIALNNGIVFFFIISLLLLSFVSIPAQAQERYGQILCQEQGYICHKVLKGESWENLFPNENERAILKRINRMNTMLHKNMIIAIPSDKENMDYMKFSPFPAQIEPTGRKVVIVDPDVLAFGAYDASGQLLRWGPVAMGKNWCPDIGSGCRTKIGQFSVYREGSSSCVSTKFPIGVGGAPMPYCMFFNGGYAMHASNEVPGYHASHGCVRMFYEDAQWLNLDFVEKGTEVIIRPYEI